MLLRYIPLPSLRQQSLGRWSHQYIKSKKQYPQISLTSKAFINIQRPNRSPPPPKPGTKPASIPRHLQRPNPAKYINTNRIEYPVHKGIPVELDDTISLDFSDEALYSLYFRQYEDVIRSFNEVEEGQVPSELDNYLYLFSLYQLERYKDVINYIEKNDIEITLDSRIHNIIFLSYFNMRKYNEATEYFEKMISFWKTLKEKHWPGISNHQRSQLYTAYYHALHELHPNDFERCYNILKDQVEHFIESLTPKILTFFLDFSNRVESPYTPEIARLFLHLKGVRLPRMVVEQLYNHLSPSEMSQIKAPLQGFEVDFRDRMNDLAKDFSINTALETLENIGLSGDIERCEEVFFRIIENQDYFVDPYDVANRMLSIYVVHRSTRIEWFRHWMKSNYIYITTENYNLLLQYYSVHRNSHEDVVRVFKEMDEECIEPNIFSFRFALNSFEKLGDLDSVKTLLDKWKVEKEHSFYILKEIYQTILRMTKGTPDEKLYQEEFLLRYPNIDKQ